VTTGAGGGTALAAGVAAVLLAACDASPDRPSPARPAGPAGPTSTAATLLADSAGGDSAAIASLPPRLAAEFTVRTLLTPNVLRDTARVSCRHLDVPTEPEERRRLRARLLDSSRVVLFARADRATGTIRRVELVRRRPNGIQRGFIWNGESDVVQTLEWPSGATVPEVADLPRGGPVPRALRALGRRLLVLPCEAAPSRS
jgi:hypothetical protein